mmetsp:Transcript_8875/g.19730  ORF Transcript_8875/g.19730 Transcript_8875/m.19730 type:complete len:112 (+) Transcript_8875:382-717(+)
MVVKQDDDDGHAGQPRSPNDAIGSLAIGMSSSIGKRHLQRGCPSTYVWTETASLSLAFSRCSDCKAVSCCATRPESAANRPLGLCGGGTCERSVELDNVSLAAAPMAVFQD